MVIYVFTYMSWNKCIYICIYIHVYMQISVHRQLVGERRRGERIKYKRKIILSKNVILYNKISSKRVIFSTSLSNYFTLFEQPPIQLLLTLTFLLESFSQCIDLMNYIVERSIFFICCFKQFIFVSVHIEDEQKSK